MTNTAQSNRAQMPQITAFVDAVRAEFGDCKVSYASENGIVRGTPWPVEDDALAPDSLRRVA